MTLQPPSAVAAVLAHFDTRNDTFEVADVHHDIEKAIPDWKAMAANEAPAAWGEWAAFGFDTHEVSDESCWKTYFQPMMSFCNGDDWSYRPDLRKADAATIAHWASRARETNHPVLKARYADLVWDTTWFVMKGKPDIEFARLAIDSYIAAANMDDGSVWMDTNDGVARALSLALSIKDDARIMAAADAMLDYVDRTSDDEKVGPYCNLFDHLLPLKGGPQLSEETERGIIERLETRFAEMTVPGSQWDVAPYSPQRLGKRLASYYQRKKDPENRTRVLRAVAQVFERRSDIGDAMSKVMFLEIARQTYMEAGLSEEAERIQLEGQEATPEAAAQLVPLTAEVEITRQEIDSFCEKLMASGGIDDALTALAAGFLPDQENLAQNLKKRNKEFPLQALFTPQILSATHIRADIGDSTGDPDGLMVHETSRAIQFEGPWIHWGLEHLVKNGLTASHVVDYLRCSPLFTEDRIPLIRRGVAAHLEGDYTQAIHILVPQIERAVVNVARFAGKPGTKPFRSGKGVLQAKNLQDALERDEAVRALIGENLRMYLLSTLAHNKGLNIRNEVCHGLWRPEHFTLTASERVLHVLLTVGLLRGKKKDAGPADAPAE